jgi:hypothetical protein|tara:strand:- start:510 stop:1025 length:516 start_codon:yes stop_codon:yes gene_type:complete
MDQYKEGIGNPFDAPVPGQSLTDTPGNYPWEHPPQITDTSEAADLIWDRLHEPEFSQQVIAMLDAGVPVEAVGRIVIFSGFMDGKFSPDVGFILVEPVMKMIASIGIKGGLKKIRMSMQDITNNEQMTSIIKLKQQGEEFEKISKGVKQDIKKIDNDKKGLMTKPEKEEVE